MDLQMLRLRGDAHAFALLLRVALSLDRPVLREKSGATEQLLVRVAKDQAKADRVREGVEQEEKAISERAEETEEMARDARRDLEAALPALEAANEALSALDKKDITEIRSFVKPPALVLLVAEAVCVLLDTPEVDWANAKRLLSDPQLL